jgi:hypothetical protein
MNMYQAITTKYLGPTNARGSRILARCAAKRITVAWNHALNPDANHRGAAMALVKALDWDDGSDWYGGSLPDGTGYAFVRVVRG